ncbi:MAG: hypothetical protein JAZ03_14460 [Candidatus Thiodiazotropha taylori]|nr:hypothetical protein [Candidatus Thiodiazotropha taylori]
MESYVKHEWGYHIYMSSFSGNRRGVLTLINNTFEYDIGEIIKDPDGNFLITELKITDKKITLINIYGPNEDKPQFYNNIQQLISDIGNENVILCGDWNLVLDPSLDTDNYKQINNPRARKRNFKYYSRKRIYRCVESAKRKYKTIYLEKIKSRQKTGKIRFFFSKRRCF